MIASLISGMLFTRMLIPGLENVKLNAYSKLYCQKYRLMQYRGMGRTKLKVIPDIAQKSRIPSFNLFNPWENIRVKNSSREM